MFRIIYIYIYIYVCVCVCVNCYIMYILKKKIFFYPYLSKILVERMYQCYPYHFDSSQIVIFMQSLDGSGECGGLLITCVNILYICQVYNNIQVAMCATIMNGYLTFIIIIIASPSNNRSSTNSFITFHQFHQ